MEFEYIEYGGSLIRGIKRDPKNIYVFSDYLLKNSQQKDAEKERNIFEPDPLYLTMDELKGMIFETDRVVLSEAKRFVDFYKVMEKDLEEINIKSYFESIEFADKFFKFYREKNRAMCQTKIELEMWQEEFFQILEKFKEKYEKYLDEKKYIPKDWLENEKNIDFSLLEGYEKIVFVDIVSFSTLEKYIVRKLDEKFQVVIRLQMDPESFDESSLELKEIKLPKEQKVKIRRLEVASELELAGNLLTILKETEEHINVFSPEADKNRYFKIFPQNFMQDGLAVLNDTKFFKFLETQNNLLLAMDFRGRKVKIPIDIFLDGISTIEFKEYYGVGKEEIDYLYTSMDFGNKYVDSESNEIIDKIYKDLIRVQNLKEMKEFIEYFNELLENPIFKEKEFIDFHEKLQEYMGYAKSTEVMLKVDELKECFKNGGEILKFLLQYFNNVEIKRLQNTENKVLIKNLDECRVLPAKGSIFINTSSSYLPKIKRDELYLTEKQKRENGFKYYEKERREEKYRFYQALLKNRYNLFIYIKNDIENISPLLTEVISSYEVKEYEKKVTEFDILNSFKNLSSEEIEKFNEKELLKEVEDYPNGSLSIGPYDYNILSTCEFRFYLEKIAKLNKGKKESSKELSAKFLGIYIHEIYEKLTDKMWKKILNSSDYSLDESEIYALLNDSLNRNEKKIPQYLREYFKMILIPRFAKNIIYFYKKLEDRYKGQKLTRVESEKKASTENPFFKGKINLFLKGVVDLIIEGEGINHIIDFKTGKKADNQLDFYSIMLFGDERNSQKSIYNAFDGKLEDQKEIKLTIEKLREDIQNFFVLKPYYDKSSKKSGCLYCEYEKICRRDQ